MNEKNADCHIILPIEVKKRELISKILLSVHFVNDGHPVIIGDRGGCFRELSFVNKSIYLAKSLSIGLRPTFNKVKEQNGKTLVLFEEGGYVLRENNKNEELKSFYPKEMLPYVDVIMTYGKGYQDLLIESFPELNSSNTFVSGNARFDLHKPKYHELYSKEISEIKSKYGEYILINTNFGLANHVLGDEYIINEFKKSLDFTSDLVTYYTEMQNDQKKDHRDFVSMINTIALEFPNQNFVVRPHPIENKEFYISSFSDLKNVFIKSNGSATPWILGSKIIIHKDCTTGLESSFAKKPIISYQPTNDPNILWLPPLVSDVAHTKQEIITKISSYINNNQEFKITEENRNIIANEVENVKNFTPELIINLIRELKNEKTITTKRKTGLTNKLKTTTFKFYKRSRNYIGWLKRKYLKNDYYSKSFEGLRISEVQYYFDKMKNIENMDFNYTVRKKGINTFLIERKH